MKSSEITEASQLSVLVSSCQKCRWAEYKEKTQVGCTVGRIDKFREQDAVVEAENEEGQFYLLNGRTCNLFREKTWAGTPEQARKEVAVRLDVVIPLQSFDVVELETTVLSVRGLALKANSITFINNQDEFSLPEVHFAVRKMADGLPWSLTDILKRNSEGGRLSREASIDEVTNKLKGDWLTILSPGETLPNLFSLDLDRAINDDLKRFKVVLNPLTISSAFYKKIDGNQTVTFEDSESPLLLSSFKEKLDHLISLGMEHLAVQTL